MHWLQAGRAFQDVSEPAHSVYGLAWCMCYRHSAARHRHRVLKSSFLDETRRAASESGARATSRALASVRPYILPINLPWCSYSSYQIAIVFA